MRVRTAAAQIMRASLANSDGWTVNPPKPSQFRLPFTVMPRGVNTRPRDTTAAPSSGQASHRMCRVRSRARPSMSATPAAVHMACLSGRSYGFFPAATDSTEDAEATSIRPSAARTSTTARMTGRVRSRTRHRASVRCGAGHRRGPPSCSVDAWRSFAHHSFLPSGRPCSGPFREGETHRKEIIPPHLGGA